MMAPLPSVQLRQSAVDDLRETFLLLAQTNRSRAQLFVRNLQDALTLLSAYPLLGTPRSYADARLQLLRHWPLKGFKHYGVFYRPLDSNGGIEVWRVLRPSVEEDGDLLGSLKS